MAHSGANTKLGFSSKEYLTVKEQHICLYRDSVEVVLTKSTLSEIIPVREMHGYGYDGYFTGADIKELYKDFVNRRVQIVKPLELTDYDNLEFVFEDIDRRWIGRKGQRETLRG